MPGTQRRHRHAAVLQFVGERLRQRQHVGLGRGVGRQQRDRLEGGDRCDVQHAAVPALLHRRKEVREHARQRGHVQVDQFLVSLRQHPGELALLQHARVVDQNVDRDVPAPQGGRERAGRVARVRSHGSTRTSTPKSAARPPRATRASPCFARPAPGVTHPREALGQRLADPGRGAGDQRGLPRTSSSLPSARFRRRVSAASARCAPVSSSCRTTARPGGALRAAGATRAARWRMRRRPRCGARRRESRTGSATRRANGGCSVG